MTKASSVGTWVWNVRPVNSEAHLKVTAGQLEVDGNGVHLCAGPGHCGGLVASFPLGTLVWREESPAAGVSPAAPGPVEIAGAELAQFDMSPRIEVGAINITVASRADAAPALDAVMRPFGPIRLNCWPF